MKTLTNVIVPITVLLILVAVIYLVSKDIKARQDAKLLEDSTPLNNGIVDTGAVV